MDDTYDLNPSVPTKVDTDPVAIKPNESQLDRLRDVLSKRLERPNRLIEVPERPEIQLIFSPNITQTQFKQWTKLAGEGTKKDGADSFVFACIVVAQTARGLIIDGEEVLDENEYPLTFASPTLKDMLGYQKQFPDGVKALFGVDAHVLAAASAILDAAGYGDTVETTEDPLATS
jgi:hypothetical protein